MQPVPGRLAYSSSTFAIYGVSGLAANCLRLTSNESLPQVSNMFEVLIPLNAILPTVNRAM